MRKAMVFLAAPAFSCLPLKFVISNQETISLLSASCLGGEQSTVKACKLRKRRTTKKKTMTNRLRKPKRLKNANLKMNSRRKQVEPLTKKRR